MNAQYAHMAADFRPRFWIILALTLPILALVILFRSNPLAVVAVVAVVQLSRSTYWKMIHDLLWTTRDNVVAIPLAVGALYAWGVLQTPAVGGADVGERGDRRRQRATCWD